MIICKHPYRMFNLFINISIKNNIEFCLMAILSLKVSYYSGIDQ